MTASFLSTRPRAVCLADPVRPEGRWAWRLTCINPHCGTQFMRTAQQELCARCLESATKEGEV